MFRRNTFQHDKHDLFLGGYLDEYPDDIDKQLDECMTDVAGVNVMFPIPESLFQETARLLNQVFSKLDNVMASLSLQAGFETKLSSADSEVIVSSKCISMSKVLHLGKGFLGVKEHQDLVLSCLADPACKVKTLDVIMPAENEGGSPDQVAVMFQELAARTQLTVISINEGSLKLPHGMEAFADFISKSSSLQSLRLTKTEIEAEGLEQIFNALSQRGTLKHIHISKTEVTVNHPISIQIANHITKIVKSNPDLETLHLGLPLHPDGVAIILPELAEHKGLVDITILEQGGDGEYYDSDDGTHVEDEGEDKPE